MILGEVGFRINEAESSCAWPVAAADMSALPMQIRLI